MPLGLFETMFLIMPYFLQMERPHDFWIYIRVKRPERTEPPENGTEGEAKKIDFLNFETQGSYFRRLTS